MNKLYYIILGLLITTLISCQENIITTSNKDVINYSITDIEIIIGDSTLCKYYFNTNLEYVHYKDKGTFKDSIGKYKIRDKVKVEFIKNN